MSLLLTLFLSVFQTPAAMSINQQAPDLVMRNKTVTSGGEVVKGLDPDSNSTEFQLIYSGFKNTRVVDRIWGSPDISLNSTHIHVNGSVSGQRVSANKSVGTFLQKDAYIDDVAVGERILASDSKFSVIDFTLPVDEVNEVPGDYDLIDADSNFTHVIFPDHGVDVFITKYFIADIVPINNSLGEIMGYVYGFKVVVLILIYDTNDHSFLGLHKIEDTGYGNALPNFVHLYLVHLPEWGFVDPNESLEDKRPGLLEKIDWMDHGYNETLGLNLLRGFYYFERNAITFILPRTATPALTLNAVDFENVTPLESLIDELTMENELTGFDDDNLEKVDDELISVTLDEEGKTLEDPFETAISSSSTTETSSIIESDPSLTDESSSNLADTEDPAELPYSSLFSFITLLLIPIYRRKYNRNN
ncbi:MAG: hypothetical protein ACW99A_06490 [Candidatus Kariarchaeaceae archaeon]